MSADQFQSETRVIAKILKTNGGAAKVEHAYQNIRFANLHQKQCGEKTDL